LFCFLNDAYFFTNCDGDRKDYGKQILVELLMIVVDGIIMADSKSHYKLYGIPYLGSMVIEFLMEEANIKYDIIFPTQEERNSEEFKKISPKGLVPVLITPNGLSIFEGLAIINFLLETHQTNLIAPIGNPDRAKCWQWLSFLATALGNANNRFFFPERYGSTENVIKEKAALDRKACYDILQIHSDLFLSGKAFGIADFYFYMFMQWDEDKTSELAKRPKLEKIYNHIDQKLSIQKVLKNQTPQE